jgi:Fe-S-cluster-containing hydrogenase component 2
MILVNEDVCDLCGACVSVCPVDAMEMTHNMLAIIESVCVECDKCIHICPVEALRYDSVSV